MRRRPLRRKTEPSAGEAQWQKCVAVAHWKILFWFQETQETDTVRLNMRSNGTSAEKLRSAHAGSGTLCQADGSDSEVEDPPGSRSHTGVNPTMMNPGFGGRQHVYALFVSRKIKRSILPHWTNDAHRGVKCVWLFWKPLQVFLFFLFFSVYKFQMIPDDSRWFQMIPDDSRWFQM